MTMLWKEDPFHKEWDFMCAVYSAIREFLSDENVSLQIWIQFATKHLGIVARQNYLTALGWELIQIDDGTHQIQRTAVRSVQSYVQPLNGLGLFMNCLNDGLPVANPLAIITKLSDLANDIICVNTQPGAEEKPTSTMDGFRQFAKNNPQLAMSALFQLPAAHPLVAQGVAVHHVNGLPPAGEPLFMVQNDDPELDAMLNTIFHGQGNGSLGGQTDLDNPFFIGPPSSSGEKCPTTDFNAASSELTELQTSTKHPSGVLSAYFDPTRVYAREKSHRTTPKLGTNTWGRRAGSRASQSSAEPTIPSREHWNAAVHRAGHIVFPYRVACPGRRRADMPA